MIDNDVRAYLHLQDSSKLRESKTVKSLNTLTQIRELGARYSSTLRLVRPWGELPAKIKKVEKIEKI